MLERAARTGSGFTALSEASTPALSLSRELPVRQAAALLRCNDKPRWRRIEFYVVQADLDAMGLLFATHGRDHQTVVDVVEDLKAH